MRYLLIPLCALTTLTGCGKTAPEPPQAAIQPGSAEKPLSQPGKEQVPPAKAGKAAAKQAVSDPAANQAAPGAEGSFDGQDPERTLSWLRDSFAKVRGTPDGDVAAAERAWDQYASAVKAAEKQKVHWTVRVEALTNDGIVTEPLKTAADTACRGLRLKPDRQPPGFSTFILQWPAAARGPEVRAGDRVTVTGVVERIETEPGRSRPHARNYGFNVRLSDYHIAPAK